MAFELDEMAEKITGVIFHGMLWRKNVFGLLKSEQIDVHSRKTFFTSSDALEKCLVQEIVKDDLCDPTWSCTAREKAHPLLAEKEC